MAFYEIEPFGTEKDFLGHAITSSVIANVNRKKGSKAVTPQEFMPKFERESDSIEGAIGFVSSLTAMLGGEDKRHGNDS